MVPERALLALAGAVLAASVIGAAAAPGVVDRPDEVVRPGFVGIEEVAIAEGSVSGASATLEVETALVHRGNPADDVSVVYRAFDLESGLLVRSVEVGVGTVDGDREVRVPGELSVPREGGYRIEAIVYRDGERLGSAVREVRGVGTLQPAYAVSSVGFHRFQASDQPVIEYSIAGTDGDRTTLRIRVYLTNEGDEPAGGLRLALKARQADSNIVAAETDVRIGTVEPGRTATPTAELTVPAGYNYFLDAQLWRDGVMVSTARSAANLNPTETISVNETRREIGLEVSDFDRDRGAEGRPSPEPRAATAAPSGQPGFGPLAAAVALALAAGLFYWRRSP